MLSERPQQDSDLEFHCITCSDQALPFKVVSVDAITGLARVEAHGENGEVDISLVDDVRPGDTVLVHGGVALATLRIDGQSG